MRRLFGRKGWFAMLLSMLFRPRYRGKPYVEPPAGPTGLTATPVSGRKIQLDWTDNAANEDLYGVWFFAVGAPVPDPLPHPPSAELAADAVQWTSAAAPDGTQYRYIVAAGRYEPTAPSGPRHWSTEAQVIGTHEAASAPSAPTASGSVTSTTQLKLDWTISDTEDDLGGFRAYIREQGDSTWIPNQFNDLTRATRTIPFTGLVAGTTYELMVRAFNTQGTADSNVVTLTTTSATVPTTPTLDSIAHDTGELFDVTFTNADAASVECHREFSLVGATGPWTPYDQFADTGLPLFGYANGQHTIDGAPPGFRIPGFSSGQVWSRVRVKRDGLYSAYSNVATVTV